MSKQGWTVTLVLVDTPVREEDPLDEKDIRQAMETLDLLAGLTVRSLFIKKHASIARSPRVPGGKEIRLAHLGTPMNATETDAIVAMLLKTPVKVFAILERVYAAMSELPAERHQRCAADLIFITAHIAQQHRLIKHLQNIEAATR